MGPHRPDPRLLAPPPHLVHEIAVLADQRRRAGIVLNSDGLEDWHRYTATGFQDRLKARLKSHCEHDHQPPPSRARHARHVDAAHTRDRDALYEADVDALGPAQDVDLHRPRLALVDPDTGELP